MYKHLRYLCIFGGGAVRGFSYLGAIRALEELQIKPSVFAGSSVGALFSTFCALGVSVDDIEKIFLDINFELFRDINLSLLPDFAISKGELFLDWIRENIEKYYYKSNYIKGKNPSVCFKDLDKNLIIITTDLKEGVPFIFSRNLTPEFEVAQAVRISASMPGLLKPIVYQTKLLADGDLLKGVPLWRLHKELCPDELRILEFRLEGQNSDFTIKSTLEYLNTVYSCMTGYSTDYIMEMYQPKDKFDYIKIDTKDLILVNFNIPKTQKYKLLELGYLTTKKYFEQSYPLKRKELFNAYSDIFQVLTKIRKFINKNKILMAQNELSNLFITLCDFKSIIDIMLYEKIIVFKNIFYENLTKNIFQYLVLKNEKLINVQLDILINDLENKVKELTFE